MANQFAERFSRGQNETEDEFLCRIRVNGYWKFTTIQGLRIWRDHWGPRPEGPTRVPLAHDPRPTPPPSVPYKD